MKLLFLWRSLRCSVMQQRTDESRLVCLQDFVNACICTALCRLGFTQLPLCQSVCLSASFPSARSFAVTGNSFCSTGEENLQTLETALVPHTTLNSVIFLDNQPELWVMCLTPSSLKTLHKIHLSLISENISSEEGNSAIFLVGKGGYSCILILFKHEHLMR